MSDQGTGTTDGTIVEQVDATTDDPGGIPYDDSFDDAGGGDGGDRGEGQSYDSAKVLQSRGIGYPDTPPVGMTVLKDYVTGRWGGTNLGILAKPPRPIRGGQTPSLHDWGIAWDWRWGGPGPGRATAETVMSFCIDNAAALGIQAVHDYQACRYWKSYAGWRNATASPTTGFGQPWGQWLHIERTWAAANLATGIDQLLSEAGAAVPAATPAPSQQPTDAGPIALPDSNLKVGSVGADVGRMQDFLRFFHFADFTRSDGQYGPRTQAAVVKAQQAFAAKGWYTVKIDGQWGPKTNAAAGQFLAALKP